MHPIRSTLICLLTTLAVAAIASADDEPVVHIWPNGATGEPAFDAKKIEKAKNRTTTERIAYVDNPTLTLYLAPKEKATGTCVVICPGGGYNILAWPKEGLEVAEWLNTLGVSAAVLKYRVPRRGSGPIQVGPLQDVQRAVRVARANAKKWNVDPRRVGVLGFSAGGHLTVMAGTHYDDKTYDRVDDADDLSARPDFLIPIYAAYLGAKDDPYKLNNDVKVTKKTPPTFMAVTWDDKHRGAHAALLFVELKKHGVPAEVHVYSKGGHGYGLRPSDKPVSTWHHRCGEWLKMSGLLDPAK